MLDLLFYSKKSEVEMMKYIYLQHYRAQGSSSANVAVWEEIFPDAFVKVWTFKLGKFKLSTWERKGWDKTTAALSQGSVRYSPMHTLHCPRPITCHKLSSFVKQCKSSFPAIVWKIQTCSTHSLVKPRLTLYREILSKECMRNPKQRMYEKSLAENVQEILNRECMRNPKQRIVRNSKQRM